MFINNKYTSWYWSIITRAQSRVLSGAQYTERHHIVPRCMGGSNAKSNLVTLTAKEHYIVQLLLPKMAQGRNKYKLQVALWRMCSFKDGRHVPSNRAYESAKLNMAKALSQLNTGRPLLESQRLAIKGKPAHNKGKKMPRGHGEKIAAYRHNLPAEESELLSAKISQTLIKYNSEKAKQGLNKCPKFKWVLTNVSTNDIAITTNLKDWCLTQGFTNAMIYKGSSKWIITEKYRLKDGRRLI
jgi:hypothetical protein